MNVSAYRAPVDWMTVTDALAGVQAYPSDGKGSVTTTADDSLVKDNGAIVYGFAMVEQAETSDKRLNFRVPGTSTDILPETEVFGENSDPEVVGRFISFGPDGIILPPFGIRLQANNATVIIFYTAL